jgi:hypothetical protein
LHPIVRILVLPAALLMSLNVAIAKDAVQSSQPAKWVSRDVQFIYKGVATQYSCEGLRNNMLMILQALGARREDLKVHAMHCATELDPASRAPGVQATISVLVPATAAEVSRGDPNLVRAHWTTVDLTRIHDLDTSHGQQCELLEQTQRDVLPLFTSRHVDFSSFCIPNTEESAGLTFKVDVLQVDSKAAVN